MHFEISFAKRRWASASYQIRKIAGCACAGNAGNVFPRRRIQRKPLVSDPGMHHCTCVTHVPWCMSGSLTRGGGENVPGFPGACAPAILRIWQEAHVVLPNVNQVSYVYKTIEPFNTGHAYNKKNILTYWIRNSNKHPVCLIWTSQIVYMMRQRVGLLTCAYMYTDQSYWEQLGIVCKGKYQGQGQLITSQWYCGM